MKTKKQIKKQKQADIQFIISAVTSELHNTAYFQYNDTWENNGGMQWFFDECVDITHKVMLTEGSPYLKWLDYWSKTEDEYQRMGFIEVTGETCFDWYHMVEARKEFESRYEKDEPRLPVEREEVNFIISMLKNIEVDGETMEHIITKVGMDEQMFRQLIKKAEKYIP
jgi:hypothetical protein